LDPAQRSMAALAGALAPGHPSWVVPTGTLLGLSSASDSAVALRAAGLRAGPLRVAVLANADAVQAEAAVAAVDRWVARQPGEVRVCPSLASLPAPRSGTYALDQRAGELSEALLALPLSTDDPSALNEARWLAAALDGSDGLLARALGANRPAGPLASSWNATVFAQARAFALVVRLVAPDEVLDAAVAQVRALLDRIRQGALTGRDLDYASGAMAREQLAAALDPRARAVALWRGEPVRAAPSLEGLRAFAAATLRDEQLVIVATRPSRPDSARPFSGHDSKAK
jgi:hypothetical protein